MKKKLLLVYYLLFFVIACFAQKVEIATVDYIYLFTGDVHKGKVLDYFPEEEVNLQLESGEILTFREDKIQKIVFANEYEWKRPVLALDSKPKRIYFIFDTQASLIRINTFEGNKIRHGTIAYHSILGFKINHHLGVGIGTGFEWHFWQGPNRLIPAFLDIRGLLVKRKIAPYYNLGVGYAFPVINSFNVVNPRGGLLLHPAFGLSTPINKRLQLNIDFGLRFQKLEWEGLLWSSSQGPPPFFSRTYQRFLLKAGVVF